ncbi:uncharacterized protein G2W53_016843 [Senna tora]|uniref:Uncharacterized protein n=1 Tax=Senna tora TaxID=362788 RepID=A0A834WQJ6_9FABA|nr:uncharacterized protein G2W53_016843 [Senna tora]
MVGDSKRRRFIKFHGRWRRCATRTLAIRDSSTEESKADPKNVHINLKNTKSVEEADMVFSYSPLTQSQTYTNEEVVDSKSSVDFKINSIESLAKKHDLEIQEIKEDIGRLRTATQNHHEEVMKMLTETLKRTV